MSQQLQNVGASILGNNSASARTGRSQSDKVNKPKLKNKGSRIQSHIVRGSKDQSKDGKHKVAGIRTLESDMYKFAKGYKHDKWEAKGGLEGIRNSAAHDTTQAKKTVCQYFAGEKGLLPRVMNRELPSVEMINHLKSNIANSTANFTKEDFQGLLLDLAASTLSKAECHILDNVIENIARQEVGVCTRRDETLEWYDNTDSCIYIADFGGFSDASFAAVFRSHGPVGLRIRELVSTILPRHILDNENWHISPSDALKKAIAQMEEELTAVVETAYSGVVVTVVISFHLDVFIANIGNNSGILVCGTGGQVKVNQCITPSRSSDPEERKRIEAAKGVVSQHKLDNVEEVGELEMFPPGVLEEIKGGERVNAKHMGYPMSRSIGDSNAKQYGLSAEPVMTTFRVEPVHQYLIIGTKGVFDVLSKDRIKGYCAGHPDPQSLAEKLCYEASELWMQQFRNENSVCLILDLQRKCKRLQQVSVEPGKIAQKRRSPFAL